MIFTLKRFLTTSISNSLQFFSNYVAVEKGMKIVKCVPVMSLQHPSKITCTCVDCYMHFCIENICETSVPVVGTDILTFLRREQRSLLNKDDRWNLFDKNSPERVTAGSVLKVTYNQSKSDLARSSVFTGVLIAIRRHPSEPTFSIRAIVDNVGVEQLYPIFSPLISKIEVVKRAIKVKSNKAYWLRDNPEKASEFINKRSKKHR